MHATQTKQETFRPPTKAVFDPKSAGHRRHTSLTQNHVVGHSQPQALVSPVNPIINHSVHPHLHGTSSVIRTGNRKSMPRDMVASPGKHGPASPTLQRPKMAAISESGKKKAHRRAASLSTQALGKEEKISKYRRREGDERKKREGGYEEELQRLIPASRTFDAILQVEELLDNKHRQLLEEGVISPPSPPSISNSPLSSPRVHFVLPTQSRRQRVPSDLLSTVDDVQQEFHSECHPQDVPHEASLSHKGRRAPTPFQMISGGFFKERMFQAVHDQDLQFPSKPISSLDVHSLPTNPTIASGYFKPRTSTFPSSSPFQPTHTSAFSTYEAHEDD